MRHVNHSTIMIYNMNNFCHYMIDLKVMFHVNHSTLLYLLVKTILMGKLVHYVLIIQEFVFAISHMLT